MISIRDYLRILIPLVIAFAIYHAVAVPLLEPPTLDQKDPWPETTLASQTSWWDQYFLEGSWQRKNPKVLQTPQGILLFETREQISGTRWRIKPLTILIPQRDSATGKRPIFIENPEGAEIEFKSELDWTTGQPPPVVSGRLVGDIWIYSPPEDPSVDNGLLIETRELRIDRREISTVHAIRMQMGNSMIRGKDLTIFLDQDLLASDSGPAPANSPFNGLDSMVLRYVQQVYIGLNKGGLWPSDEVPDAREREAHATLECGGAFEFQFHQSQAVFKNGVHLEHVVKGLDKDTFDCHELTFQVGWEGKSGVVASNAINPVAMSSSSNDKASSIAGQSKSSEGANWNIERLEAVGLPGRDSRDQSRWLKLNAPGMRAEARGQHLVMDFMNGKVKLSNRIPGTAARESTPVYLRREAMQLWSPEVEYRNADTIVNASNPSAATNGSNTKRLGAILADGNGKAFIENKDESWQLSWGKSLLIRPDGDNDLVIIDGRADASSPKHGRFIAEQLKVWLSPVTDEIRMKLAPYYADGKVPQALPRYMRADNDVTINSSQVRARVEQMEVWFDYPLLTSDAPNQRNNPSNNNQQVSLQPATPRLSPPKKDVAASTASMAAPNAMQNGNASQANTNNAPNNATPTISTVSNQPATSSTPTSITSLVSPSTISPLSPPSLNSLSTVRPFTASPAIPLNVTARSMIAKIMSMGDEMRLDDLQLEGNFELTKEQVSAESPWPFVATGETLRIEQVEADSSNVTMKGSPARVQVGRGWVVAPELHLHQKENQFWIDHPGDMMLPVEALDKRTSNPQVGGAPALMRSPGSNNNSMNGVPGDGIVWEEAPRISWGKRMTFDGKTARFGGNITISCRMQTDADTLWHIKASAARMSVEMDKPISLKANQNLIGTSSTPNNAQSLDGQLSMIRLEDNVDIIAVQTDRKGNRRSAEHIKVPRLDVMVPEQQWLGHGPGELLSRRLGNANPASGDRLIENTKQCIHMSFLGRMEGSIPRRLVTFYDRVDAILGPIAEWSDALNVFEVNRLDRNQTRLICDQLNIFDASQLSWNQLPIQNRAAARNAAWELDALGRVRMDSLTDTSELSLEGNRVAYNALTDVARIEGTPREPATIIRFPLNAPPGTPPEQRLSVSSATIGLKSGDMKMDVSSFESNLPPNAQPPTAAKGPVDPRLVKPPQNLIQSPRDFNPLQPTPPKR